MIMRLLARWGLLSTETLTRETKVALQPGDRIYDWAPVDWNDTPLGREPERVGEVVEILSVESWEGKITQKVKVRWQKTISSD